MLPRLIIPCNFQFVTPNHVVYDNQVAEVDHSLLFTYCGQIEFIKVVELVGGGSVINGAYPV